MVVLSIIGIVLLALFGFGFFCWGISSFATLIYDAKISGLFLGIFFFGVGVIMYINVIKTIIGLATGTV